MSQPADADDYAPPTKTGGGLLLAIGIVLGAAAVVTLFVMFSGEPAFDGKVAAPPGQVENPADIKPHPLEGQAVAD